MVRVVFLLLFFTSALFSYEWLQNPVKPLDPGFYVVDWNIGSKTLIFVRPSERTHSSVTVATYIHGEICVYYLARGYYNENDECIVNGMDSEPRYGLNHNTWSPDSFRFILGGAFMVDIIDTNGASSVGRVRKVTDYGTKLYKKKFMLFEFDLSSSL